jgi:glutamyl-tRNA synthetase
VGDFVLRRSDGVASYQLAVVVDDIASGVTDVLRGDDLLGSTPRQLLLYAALGAPPPRYAHVPLLLSETGERLAKRAGGTTVQEHRERGVDPSALVSWLARSVGLACGGTATPASLLDGFSLGLLRQGATAGLWAELRTL